MLDRITPHLVQLTYEAALKSFWRKRALQNFLLGCKISTNFINTWLEGESKRDFLDKLFKELQINNNKQYILQMAFALADQTTFPDLRNWEDSDKKNSEAAKAVKDLKYYLSNQEEEIVSEKEKEVSKKRAQETNLRVQRAKTDRERLKNRLEALYTQIGTRQAGLDFQNWFYDLLDYCDIENRRPYINIGREIDGALTHDGTTYLVELKFTTGQSGAEDIDSLKAKVNSKADNTMGIMLSISGYSSVAIKEASGTRTPLILIDHSHVYCFLSEVMNFQDIISRVRRHVSQTGEAYLPINKFNG